MGNYYHSDNYLKGTLGKEVVRSLLESSGYTVCSYGYEETLLDVKSKYTFKKYVSKTGRRLTHSPDLLVYDTEDTIMLVEVKTRGKSRWVKEGEVWIKSDELKPLKDFWSDSIIAVLVPEGNVFYAKRVDGLEILESEKYSLSTFQNFQDVFSRVSSEDIEHYKTIASQMLNIFTSEKEKEPSFQVSDEENCIEIKPNDNTSKVQDEKWWEDGDANLQESNPEDEIAEKAVEAGICPECGGTLIQPPLGSCSMGVGSASAHRMTPYEIAYELVCSKCGVVFKKSSRHVGR